MLVTVPFSFSHSASNISSNFLNRMTQRGKIEVFASNFLLDTTVPFEQISYESAGDFSMM